MLGADTNKPNCGESKTQRKLVLDEKRDSLMDGNRVKTKKMKTTERFVCFILFLSKQQTCQIMMKNDAGVLLSSFLLQIRANKKEHFFDTIISSHKPKAHM